MRALIAFVLRQHVLLNVAFVAIVLFSIYGVFQVPIDRYPNIQFGEAQIFTAYPGASPEEVERLVTDEIEEGIRAMQEVEQIEFVRSVSIPGMSVLNVKFLDDTDYDLLHDKLRSAVLGVQNRLPTLNGKPLVPEIREVEADEWLPVLQLNLIPTDPGRGLDKRALILMAEDLRTRLEQDPGVKKVILLGDEQQQVELILDPASMEAQRVTFGEVQAALRRNGVDLPSGLVDTDLGERMISVDTRYRDLDDFRDVIIRRDGDGNFLTLGELLVPGKSAVRSISQAVRFTANGRDCVACKVLKRADANVLRVKDRVLKVARLFEEQHVIDGLKIVPTMDSTVEIKEGLGVLGRSLMLSVVLVMGLLFAFMTKRGPLLKLVGLTISTAAILAVAISADGLIHGIAIGISALFIFLTCRPAVLTVAGIVFAFLGSLLVFYLTGNSINEISLLGLILVTGIIVDDAIVVLENIHRHREEGASLHKSVVDGTAEVFLPVLSATLTTMAAFLPMLLMTGAVGDFFSLVPIAVNVALIISLIECLFMLPVHVVDLEKMFGRERGTAADEGKIMQAIGGFYERWLGFNLKRPLTVLAGTALLFLLAVGIVYQSFVYAPQEGQRPLLKQEFFPDETVEFNGYLTMEETASREETAKVVREISNWLIGLGPGKVESVVGMAGMQVDSSYRPAWASQFGFLVIRLPAREARTFADPMRFLDQLRDISDQRFADRGFRLAIRPRPSGPPVGLPVNIRVTGLDDGLVQGMADELLAYLQELAAEGRKLDGVIDLAHDRDREVSELVFRPDQTHLGRYGLTAGDVSVFVAGAIDGAYVGEMRRSDGDLPARVRFADAYREDPVRLASVPLINRPDGTVVRFADLGTIERRQQPASLIKRDFQRTITITGDFREASILTPGHVTAEVNRWYKREGNRFPGVAVAYGGEAESTAKSYASLFVAFLVGIAIIYAVLASQFRSYLQPFLIMSNIFFSFTGVVLVMAAFSLLIDLLGPGVIKPERALFTVQSFIGLVGLTGLVINDAIVFIDFINRLRERGMPLEPAILIAGRQRLRPILMTTFTTIAGLLPMAIGIPEFNIAWSPFATCFIAGLSMATLMTLLVLPVLYLLLIPLTNGLAGLAWLWDR